MTREKAISELLGHIDCYGEETNVALEMAITALREQEDRSKGCEYCKKLKTREIHFCPMCGRKLEVEK